MDKNVMTWFPLAFDRQKDKLVGAILGIPDFYELWLNQPITRTNIDSVMVNKNYTGLGILSALENFGGTTVSSYGVNYHEGTSIWNKNPDAIKKIFPHGKPVRKHIVFQKRLK